MSASQRLSPVAVTIAVAFLASACSAAAAPSDDRPFVGLVRRARRSADRDHRPDARRGVLLHDTRVIHDARTDAGPSATAPVAGALALKVIGAGSYPGVTVVAPPGWHVNNFSFVDPLSGPVLGISVWDVGKVPRDPCHWLGQLSDPGPTVDNLVKALVAQPLRHASKPTSVTLAGYSGQYLEWSVPSNMVVTGDSDFKGCDVQPSNGHLDFVSWPGNGKGERYQQVAGQVDRLWVLDVNGQRLVVDATHTPAATPADLAEQEQIVKSLRFVRQ